MLGSTLPSSGLASARLCELGGDGGFKIHRSLFCPCLWTRLCHSDTVCRSGMMHLALWGMLVWKQPKHPFWVALAGCPTPTKPFSLPLLNGMKAGGRKWDSWGGGRAGPAHPRGKESGLMSVPKHSCALCFHLVACYLPLWGLWWGASVSEGNNFFKMLM